MKLVAPVWQTAWYEEGLSERFVQEAARLEKTAVRDLSTSAEWVEQLVIELGQLTQNMIHLEGDLPRPHQLKLALERALKLAALSAHLMAALDQAIDHGPAVLRYSEGAAAQTNTRAPAPVAPLPPSFGHAPGTPVLPGTTWPASEAALTPAVPVHASPVPAAPTPAAPALRTSPHVQVGMKRQSGTDPRPAAAPPRESAKPAPLVTNLMEISQPMIETPVSPAREMILALSRRGLSRSEIEVITEQPRHIIEAVLQNG
jgi:hypothetical protein